MARSSLVDTTTEQLVERVATGVFPVGEPLPAQDALAVDLGVSRLTVREAIKALADRGLLRVEHGSGTFVNPPHRWTDIEALSRRADASNDLDVRKALIEVRRMIEVGAADLCARRHGPEACRTCSPGSACRCCSWAT